MLQKIILLFSCHLLMACAGPPPVDHIRVSGLSPTKIILKNSKDQYVRLNAEDPHYLILDANEAQADTFFLCDLGRNQIALKVKESYVSVFLPLKHQVVLRQEHIDTWERLTLEEHGDFVSFKGFNDKYLQPTNGSILAASSAALNEACLFEIIEL